MEYKIGGYLTRSGKTYLDYYIIPKRIRATKNNGLLVLLGNTRGTLERNILDPMRDIWGTGLVGNVSSDNTVRLFGKKVYALGADKKTSVSKIQGAGIEYCYGDEVTTWSEEVFQMLKSRLDKPNSVFDGTCNPDNPNHWFKEFLDSDADIYHQHYTIDDNPFLDPFFVEQLKKEYAGSVYYQRFILGQWARAEGLVYDMFYEDKNVVETIDIPYKLLLQIGNISLTLCNLKDARNISKSREIADWLWKNAFNYDRFALVYKFTTEYAANWTDKEPLNELSSTLKKLRHSIRLSQEKFAKYLEIPFRTYQNWETGHRVPPKYLVKLIEYKIEREAKIRREK